MASVFLLLFSFSAFSQTYPFTLPSQITATLDINTTQQENANNKLLGYNIFSFTTNAEKDLIRLFDPITIRFPDGVWSNFYDWETDSFDSYVVTSYNNSPYDDILLAYQNSNIGRGFSGLTSLNSEKKSQNGGAGYDMLWTFNLNYDDAAENVARLNDHVSKGFDVRDIEIGNEHHWANQRSLRTATPEAYVIHAKSVSQALKAAKSDVRISISLAEEDTNNFRIYNTTMVDDNQYFDAISVHRYIGDKPFSSDKSISFAEILTGRLDLKKHIDFSRSFAPGKPVWLSEWGYNNSLDKNAACALGMADSFLYLFENQDIYERANWFAANKVLNGFVDVQNFSQVIYPITKTPYGSVYEIIRSVFENSTLLFGTMESPQITITDGSMNAISARAVIKDRKITVFAVNLTDKDADFNLKFNGTIKEDETFVHGAYQFSSLDEINMLPYATDPLSTVKTGSGSITLPSLSVNKIVFDNESLSMDSCKECNNSFDNKIYPNPSTNGLFTLKRPENWKVFTINGIKIAEGEGASINLFQFAKGLYFVNLSGPKNYKVIIK